MGTRDLIISCKDKNINNKGFKTGIESTLANIGSSIDKVKWNQNLPELPKQDKELSLIDQFVNFR